jgi:hypothetical protein
MRPASNYSVDGCISVGWNPHDCNKKRPIAKAIRRFLAEDEGFDYQKGADSVQPESGNTPPGCCI